MDHSGIFDAVQESQMAKRLTGGLGAMAGRSVAGSSVARHITRRSAATGGLLAVLCVACGKQEGSVAVVDTSAPRPDSNPVMLNREMPFRYPPALYAEKVQGNVTLRLYVDSAGIVVEDSTKVVESSRSPMLDSAALKGSRELHFAPARLRGVAMPVAILFPVYFRHPEAPPPPGDSILKRGPSAAMAPDTGRGTASGTRPSAAGDSAKSSGSSGKTSGKTSGGSGGNSDAKQSNHRSRRRQR